MATISGGDKLEAKLKALADKVARPATLRVGFLEGATYPDGTPVALIAAIQNAGAPARGIPPRPFFSNFVRRYSNAWGDQLAAILKLNDWDAPRSLGQMGMGMAGQLRQQIVETMAPPLSDITLMLRKMKYADPDLQVTGATVGEAARRVAAGESVAGVPTKPLVETGHMLASVDSEVVTR